MISWLILLKNDRFLFWYVCIIHKYTTESERRISECYRRQRLGLKGLKMCVLFGTQVGEMKAAKECYSSAPYSRLRQGRHSCELLNANWILMSFVTTRKLILFRFTDWLAYMNFQTPTWRWDSSNTYVQKPTKVSNFSGGLGVFFLPASSYYSFFFLDATTVQCGPSPPYWTSPSQFKDLPFHSVILYLSTSFCTQFHHLLFARPLSRLPWGLLLNTWLTHLLLSILLTWPIQFNRPTLTNESMSESLKSCINSLLYRFLQFPLL